MTDLAHKEIIGGVTDALAALVPDDINDDYRADTGRLINACCEVLSGDFDPKEIKDALTGFKNGYGCWLDWVREAIKKTEVLGDVDRAAVLGAFEMARPSCSILRGIISPAPKREVQQTIWHCHIGQEKVIFEPIWLGNECPKALKYRHAG